MKIKFLITLVLSFIIVSFSYSMDAQESIIIKLTYKTNLHLTETTIGETIHHTHFSLSYAEEYEQAYWVAYELVSSELEPNYERTDKFLIDPKVSTGSAEADDYSGSGYDRGHLMPAAVCVWDSVAMEESFFYSNISPQNASFNRGVWSRLEDLERDLVMKYDTVLVVITSILETIIEKIRENQVAVSGAFGRAFLANVNGTYKGIALILSNESKSSSYDLIENVTWTINQLKSRIGINILQRLNDLDEEFSKVF